MISSSVPDNSVIKRAQGCLLGQLAGDSLGSLVEFKTKQEILRQYPNGVRQLADGGTWNTIAGQPTDDSEMALASARTILAIGQSTPKKIWIRLPAKTRIDPGNFYPSVILPIKKMNAGPI